LCFFTFFHLDWRRDLHRTRMIIISVVMGAKTTNVTPTVFVSFRDGMSIVFSKADLGVLCAISNVEIIVL
jgi:hypothetical protein